MSRVKDKDVAHSGAPDPDASAKEPPGRVEVDSRGHNVWRWTRDANDSTSVVLKRLDNEELALESTHKVPIARSADAASKGMGAKSAASKGAGPKRAPAKEAPALQPERGRDDSGGFDPYNSR